MKFLVPASASESSNTNSTGGWSTVAVMDLASQQIIIKQQTSKPQTSEPLYCIMNVRSCNRGAPLLGNQWATPYRHCDYENHTSYKGRLIGCQGAALPYCNRGGGRGWRWKVKLRLPLPSITYYTYLYLLVNGRFHTVGCYYSFHTRRDDPIAGVVNEDEARSYFFYTSSSFRPSLGRYPWRSLYHVQSI